MNARNNERAQEYLRSLQRVTTRFRLDAFAGEAVGDVTIELYENCSCTLFALIGTVAGEFPPGRRAVRRFSRRRLPTQSRSRFRGDPAAGRKPSEA